MKIKLYYLLARLLLFGLSQLEEEHEEVSYCRAAKQTSSGGQELPCTADSHV